MPLGWECGVDRTNDKEIYVVSGVFDEVRGNLNHILPPKSDLVRSLAYRSLWV